MFILGKGFICGVYFCECVLGYFFFDIYVSNKYYNGSEIEEYIMCNNLMYIMLYNCYRCN